MRRTVVVLVAAHNSPISITRIVPQDAKVGIFPLHLDPPTVYHQQLFKMLVAPPEVLQSGGANGDGTGVCCPQYASGSPSSHASFNSSSNSGNTGIFNSGSTTASPYGDDWDTTALSRFARRRRLLSLLKEYKRRDAVTGGNLMGGSSGSSSSSSYHGRHHHSNRNQNNYVNTNTIRSRAAAEERQRRRLQQQASSGKGPEAVAAAAAIEDDTLIDEDDFLSEEEIMHQLKRYVVASWDASRNSGRTTTYGGLATALRDEIYLDSVAFAAGGKNSSSGTSNVDGLSSSASQVEMELLQLLHEQHAINEEAYGAESAGGRIGGGGVATPAKVGKASPQHHHQNMMRNGGGAGRNGGNAGPSPLSPFSAYDAGQALSRQLLQKRRLPCQTESEIAERCRSAVSGSSIAPFDHLIVLPNSKYPAPMQQSRHLAAMASLSVRNLHPRVHMELYLLEHPEHADTAVRDLTQHFANSTIVHWLPNISDIQVWRGYTDMMEKVPMLVLRPKGFQFYPGGGAAVVGNNGSSSSTNTSADDGNKASSSSANTSAGNGSSSSSSAPSNGAATATASRFSHRSSGDTSSAASTAASSSADSSPTNGCSRKAMSADQQQSAHINAQITRALKSRLNAKELEVIEIDRLSGAGVRQLLWDRGTRHEEHGVIPPVVLRYMDSHGLYRDFRKGFAQSEQAIALTYQHATNSGKITTSSFQATVALASLVPRLEIHYDKGNLLAREQYEKLKNFECRDGQDPDLIVPIGGDGYMMHCIRQNWHRFVPFFGVNAGHRGYLLNEPKRLEELFSYPLKLYHMPMLYCEAEVAVVDTSNTGDIDGKSVPMSKARLQMEAALRPSMMAPTNEGGIAFGNTKNAGGGSSSLPLTDKKNAGAGSGDRAYLAGENTSMDLSAASAAASHPSAKIYHPNELGDGYSASGSRLVNNDLLHHQQQQAYSGSVPGHNYGYGSAIARNLNANGSPIMTRGEAAMYELKDTMGAGGGRGGRPEKKIRFEKRTELAFNDAWIDRASGQTAWLRVIVNNTEQLKRVRGDGVLVSTAAGSTAYAQALGASPIPADVQLIQLVGSNIVSPSRWRPVHLNQSDSVTLEVIDTDKRPCKCFVDSNCLGIAKSLKVRTSRVASVQLAFCHSYDLQQKLYQVQFPKEDEW